MPADWDLPEVTRTLPGKLRELLDPLESVTRQIENMSSSARSGSLGLESLSNSMKSITDTLEEAKDSLGGFISTQLMGSAIGEKVIQTYSVLSDSLVGFADLIVVAAEAANTAAKGIDALTYYNRDLNESMYEQASAFGLSYDAAVQYGDYIAANSSALATAGAGWIKTSELEGAIKAMTSAGIPLEKMSDEIVSTAGSFDLLTTAVLQSQAIGMSISDYMNNMSSLMNKQGLSTQEAAEQMAMFGDVANKTGFKVSDVASNLQSFANNFSKLGISANFGKGILEGFTNSLKSMGLGFENALDLATELSGSIAKLSSNYAMAYLTFQRGDLTLNRSGTALGAGIGMRAEMLEAEKRGDQGAMGMQIAGAIKDTLASFTGGEILTVTEARDNPALEGLYYTQTKMLESMYGISDTATQDRTLELLKQLNDATESGDTDLAESLGKDLEETINTRDKTLGIQEKIEAQISNVYGEIQRSNQHLTELIHLQGGEELTGVVAAAGEGFKYATGTTPPTPNQPTAGAAAAPATNASGTTGGGTTGAAGGGTAGTTVEAAPPPPYVERLLGKLDVLINQNHMFLQNRESNN